MKAMRYHSYGDSGVLVYEEADRPVAGPGQVVRTARVFARSDAAQLGELVARVDVGNLTIDVAQRRPLADLPAVHDQSAAGQLPGKTILTP